MNPLLFFRNLLVLAMILVVLYAIALFDLYSQLSRYKNYWNINNQQSAQDDEILYVALGDSAAQGIGATSPQKGYVGLIAAELEMKHQKPVRTINLSKSGAKVKDALDTQLPQLEKLGIDSKAVVTVEIGANDMLNFNPVKFENDMDQLMAGLPSQALIADVPYFGGTRYKSKQPNVEAANIILDKLATKYNFELVPLHDKVKQNHGLLTMSFDLFHPSNYSYRENWARVFIDRLQRDGLE